ncbi:MAG: GNAT family N-acetyltransferase [Actinobacteria bacterium]|nr:GNAT family N-acetyltransferase [Actinomycetota bacterium]MCA1720315.1 GNAT family N-acetyltransferase [Actinomycetota bacterium]
MHGRRRHSAATTTPAEEVTVRLRPLRDKDGPAYFEHQRDPQANALAAFRPRDRAAFDQQWGRLRTDPAGTARAAEVDGDFVGILTSWDGETGRELAYWFGRQFWGRGIATKAVKAFLELEPTRPLTAQVAPHNVGLPSGRRGGPTGCDA